MRRIDVAEIRDAVARLCVQANRTLPPDVLAALQAAAETEPWPPAKQVLKELLRNAGEAQEHGLPLCQDTGMAFVFLELGQQVSLCGGELESAVQEGVRAGYIGGFLRKSIVADPLRRTNTGDNTPAMISLRIVPGSKVTLTVAPKGFGSENMSRIAMLAPAAGREGVERFVLDTVRAAGPNPCPPLVLGVGIGGSFDAAAQLAKKTLLRPLDVPHRDEWYAQMEQKLLNDVNATGIGPAGYGGRTTALGLAIETAPTHIAGLPVAVNISCHATRRASLCL